MQTGRWDSVKGDHDRSIKCDRWLQETFRDFDSHPLNTVSTVARK